MHIQMKQKGTEDELRRGEVSVTALKESHLFVTYLRKKQKVEVVGIKSNSEDD
jgi:hypothetical protein